MKPIKNRIALAIMAIAIAANEADGSQIKYTRHEIKLLAKTVWGEARGCTLEEQVLVIWTILQRLHVGDYGDTIEAVITASKQFTGYHSQNPVEPQIYALCARETAKWAHGGKPPTLAPYAPTVPYLYFTGDGKHNWFREAWRD